MHGVICKWGYSPALRLTHEVLEWAGLQLAQKVEVLVRHNQIVIRPVDFGPARRQEAF